MTPATATTTAKAVRPHGGGLVHATLPRAALRGRQQCPSGGVKKSLCCAAAGINALDLQATTAFAYPMTGVRQAQKLSTPLSSPIRPPAQLVVGYKQPNSGGRGFPIQHLHGEACHLVVVIELPDIGARLIIKGVPLIYSGNDPLGKTSGHLQLTQDMYMTWAQLGDWYRTQCLNMRRPFQMPSISNVRPDCILPPVSRRVVQGAVQQPELLRLGSRKQQEHPAKSLSLLSLAISIMNVREGSGSNDCQNRPESLRPSCLLFNSKVIEHLKESPAKSSNTQESPYHPDTGDLHGLRYLKLHRSPPAQPIQLSLPADYSQVQRGAA